MSIVFDDNPRRREITLDDDELAALCARSAAVFSELAPYHRGESSEIRRTAVDGLLIQRLIPSLNSITYRRKGRVPGTDTLRLDISRVLWRAVHTRGVATCHLAEHDGYMLVTEERVPPVEVIVKAALVGTPSRIYHGLFDQTDRFGKRFEPRQAHAPYVRFDYRNPLVSAAGERLRDECLPLALADRFIDTQRARDSALTVFDTVAHTLARLELQILDVCLLFDETGRVLTYELSPDNMRVKRGDWADDPNTLDGLDKDLWRSGATDEAILTRWRALRDGLEQLGG